MKGRAEEPGAEQASLQASMGGIRALLRARSRQHPQNEARAEWRPRPSRGPGLLLLRRGLAMKDFLTAMAWEEEAQRKLPERMQGDYEAWGLRSQEGRVSRQRWTDSATGLGAPWRPCLLASARLPAPQQQSRRPAIEARHAHLAPGHAPSHPTACVPVCADLGG